MHLSVVIFCCYWMKWTVKLLVCTEQANQLCKAHFNQAHKNSGLWLNWTTTGSTWNRSWDGMRKNRGSNSRSGYLWRSQLLWVSSLVWLQHRHKEQISLLACFSSSLRKMMLTTLTHASQLPPPHTPASTGYSWSPAWVARAKTCVSFMRD